VLALLVLFCMRSSLVYARYLEAQLKAPIPTICSTCEINTVKNMQLAHYVDHL
jgi:hypothetical protein